MFKEQFLYITPLKLWLNLLSFGLRCALVSDVGGFSPYSPDVVWYRYLLVITCSGALFLLSFCLIMSWPGKLRTLIRYGRFWFSAHLSLRSEDNMRPVSVVCRRSHSLISLAWRHDISDRWTDVVSTSSRAENDADDRSCSFDTFVGVYQDIWPRDPWCWSRRILFHGI